MVCEILFAEALALLDGIFRVLMATASVLALHVFTGIRVGKARLLDYQDKIMHVLATRGARSSVIQGSEKSYFELYIC